MPAAAVPLSITQISPPKPKMDVFEAIPSKTAEPIFAFGNHDTYLFATPELWQR